MTCRMTTTQKLREGQGPCTFFFKNTKFALFEKYSLRTNKGRNKAIREGETFGGKIGWFKVMKRNE